MDEAKRVKYYLRIGRFVLIRHKNFDTGAAQVSWYFFESGAEGQEQFTVFVDDTVNHGHQAEHVFTMRAVRARDPDDSSTKWMAVLSENGGSLKPTHLNPARMRRWADLYSRLFFQAQDMLLGSVRIEDGRGIGVKELVHQLRAQDILMPSQQMNRAWHVFDESYNSDDPAVRSSIYTAFGRGTRGTRQILNDLRRENRLTDARHDAMLGVLRRFLSEILPDAVRQEGEGGLLSREQAIKLFRDLVMQLNIIFNSATA